MDLTSYSTIDWPFDIHAYVSYWENSLVNKIADRAGIPHFLEHLLHRAMKNRIDQVIRYPVITNGRTDDSTFSVNFVANQNFQDDLPQIHDALLRSSEIVTEDEFETERKIILQEMLERNSIAFKIKEYLAGELLGFDRLNLKILGDKAEIESFTWAEAQKYLDWIRGKNQTIVCQPSRLKTGRIAFGDSPQTSKKIELLVQRLNVAKFKVLMVALTIEDEDLSSFLSITLVEYLLKYSSSLNLNDLVRDTYKISYGMHSFKINANGKIMLAMYCLTDKPLDAALEEEVRSSILNCRFTASEKDRCIDQMVTETKYYRSSSEVLNSLSTVVNCYGPKQVASIINLPEFALYRPHFDSFEINLQKDCLGVVS